MLITQLSVSLSVLQNLLALFCSLSESPPPSLNLSVAVNILLCDILTQAFFSFEIDLHELFFFCKVLKFLLPAPFVFFHHLFVLLVCVCVCVCICFLGDPRLVSLQVVHGSKFSSFLWICLSSISFSGICNVRDGYFCITMIIASRQNFRQTKSRRKTRSKIAEGILETAVVFLVSFHIS